MKQVELKITMTVTEGANLGASFPVTQRRVTIGRKGTDIRLSDRKISMQHCALEVEGGKVTLVDLESRNGIFVNGKKVTSAQLKNLDEIQIGFTKLKIVIVEDLEAFRTRNLQTEVDEKTSNRDIGRMIDDELKRFSKWDLSHKADETVSGARKLRRAFGLEIVEGEEAGRTIRIETETTTLGRGKADISVRDVDISRTHAELTQRGKEVVLRDLDSTNGTFVNGKKISKAVLNHEDRIQMGGTVFRVVLED